MFSSLAQSLRRTKRFAGGAPAVFAIAVAAMLMCVPAARAATIVLDFEGLKDSEPILNFYNGGTGGFGSGPGANYGISFSPDSLALINTANGGSGNFSNPPSGDTIAFFLSGAGDTMNVAGGFTTGFSFYYAAAIAGSVDVYAGANGTGALLASVALPVTPNPYTVWVPVGVTFGGTAQSVVFTGSANFIGFDNITLGSETPGTTNPVPLPAPAFAGLALLVPMAANRLRRFRKAA